MKLILLAIGFVTMMPLARASDTATNVLPWTADLRVAGGASSLVKPKEEKALVLFWGSWCSVCKNALKNDIPKLDSEIQGVAVIPVALDKDEKRATKALRDNQIAYTSYFDTSKQLQKEWKVFAAPHWVVLGKDGAEWKIRGSMSGWNMEKARELLAR